MAIFWLALCHKYVWDYASFFDIIYSSHDRKQTNYSVNKERAQARTQDSQLLPYILPVSDIFMHNLLTFRIVTIWWYTILKVIYDIK